MHARQLSNPDDPTRTFALIFDTGDEVMQILQRFAQEQKLSGSHFTAIGAFSRVELAWFDWSAREYRKIPIDEQVEVLSLIGDVSTGPDEKPKVHAHVVVGKSDGTAHGGHLSAGFVRPTLEVILTESPGHLQRFFDRSSGLALIRV